jgi:glycosyltransferase involved in cell wall biosynthesis
MSSVRGSVKRLVRVVTERADARARQLPRLLISPVQPRRSPMIWYLCPDTNVPTGGVRVIYRHVDLLNSIGIRAAVVHVRAGFSCTWFAHQTKVMSAADVVLSPADILVVPEYYGPSLADLPIGIRVVIFNQNTYRTFAGRGTTAAWRRYAESESLAAIVVVSRDNAQYARYAFPGARVVRVRDSVDGNMFHPDEKLPGRTIGYMPRRRDASARQVLDLLEIRGCADNWTIVPIEGRTENQTAEIFRTCSIFLSFSDQEGFGMPPAEAMASGCYVIGFTGLAGREFFEPNVCTPIEEGNILAFAQAVEQAMAEFDKDAQAVRDRGLAASELIRSRYSPEAQLDELATFYTSLLS